MSTATAYFESQRVKRCPSKATLKLYAPRCPMTQLPDHYRVAPANPDPPLVNFAFPIDIVDLYIYAAKHGLIKFFTHLPNLVSPASALMATRHLSEHVEYELEFTWPFRPTADSGIILGLYTNYTMGEKMLVDEDQEDVIQMVQESLGLDKSVRPKWYFEFDDEWEPGESGNETE